MTPASALIDERYRAFAPTGGRVRHRRAGRVRRFFTGRAFAWMLTLLVTAAAVAGGLAVVGDRTDTIAALRQQLTGVRADLLTASQRGDVSAGTLEALRTKVAELRKQLASTRSGANDHATTKTVTRWVPNAERVSVETTGYEGMIELRDVQITHAYGYTDLIGIAVNTSGDTLSYAQLGCTFLDADGKVLANQIDNKQSWLPDQTWGFDCSGQVRATGGILRVDELG